MAIDNHPDYQNIIEPKVESKKLKSLGQTLSTKTNEMETDMTSSTNNEAVVVAGMQPCQDP